MKPIKSFYAPLNVVPLIDVLLVLLVFALIGISANQSQLEIQLPKAGQRTASADRVIALVATPAGELRTTTGQVVSENMLKALKTKRVSLYGNGQLTYQELAKNLAVLEQHGIVDVELITHAEY